MLPAIESKSALVLDFDGPICSVFSGLPPEGIARELCDLAQIFVEVPGDVAQTADPMEVLAWSGEVGDRALVVALDSAMRRAELLAVESAQLTPGVREVVELAIAHGWTLAIASNNGHECIARFLHKHDLASGFSVIAGRPLDRPELMKPDPYIVHEALRGLAVAAPAAYFVGDSLTDIEAGRKAGVDVIALANKPGKVAAFVQESPAAVVTDWAPVIQALQAVNSVRPGGAPGAQ